MALKDKDIINIVQPDEKEIREAFERVCGLDLKEWPFAFRRFKLGWISSKERK